MGIVGFNFSKMSVERKSPVQGELSIENNVRLLNVEEIPLTLGETKSRGLRMEFEYISKYEPDIGEMRLSGEIIEVLPAEEHRKALDAWKKNKAVHKDLMRGFVNAVFRRCTVQAILLGREINLPPPVRLPSLREEEETGKKKD